MKGVQEPEDRRDHAHDESHLQPYRDRVLWLPRHKAAEIASSRVSNRAIRSPKQLEAGQAGAGRGFVFGRRPHPESIGNRLPGRAEHAKCYAEGHSE
jgi:hypothetical protein